MLSDTDRAILDLHSKTWRYPGAKVAAITALGLSEARFYQRLRRLRAVPAAWEYAPTVLKRVA